MTFFTNTFRTPTLGFLLGDVPLILYNSGTVFEISAVEVFMWEQDEETGPPKSQKRSLAHASALPSTLLPNYLQNFMYMKCI